MLKIVKRPLAKTDIKKIWKYTYNNWGKKQADDYTYGLGRAIETILDSPKTGIKIDYIRQGYRMYHHRRHLVIYRLTPTTIEIVRVLGEKMDVERHF